MTNGCHVPFVKIEYNSAVNGRGKEGMSMMDFNYKLITAENLETEHICCAISEKKGENCVSSKKAWMKARLEDGLVFYKLDVRGKVFIEYIPAEAAWCPLEADGYMYINCFWVSGQYKGQGHADQLLEHCIADSRAKGKKGLVILSSHKKRPFLADPGYLKYKGFLVADTAEPYFELLYLPFESGHEIPKFRPYAKEGTIKEKGLVLYYTNQCPHTDKYVPVLEAAAKEKGMKVTLIKIACTQDAQNAPSPFTTYSLFLDGHFLTNEILSEKSFEKLLQK